VDEAALALMLEKCLEEIESGLPPEQAVERYPALREELLPLLQVAELLTQPPAGLPDKLTPRLEQLAAHFRNP
jgi:hypothetical protein